MTWRGARILTLLLLVLLMVAPHSSGDEGHWLSLTSAPAQHYDTMPAHRPAELSILVPDDAVRVISASTIARPERVEAPKTLGLAGAAWPPGSTERWTVVVSASPFPHGEVFAAGPAAHAPPA